MTWEEVRLSVMVGFPIFDLPPSQKLAIQLAAPSIKAERDLERYAGQMTADGLYDAVLLATGSRAQAERAFHARRSAELRSGQPVPE